jgi:hypothetical protein
MIGGTILASDPNPFFILGTVAVVPKPVRAALFDLPPVGQQSFEREL